MPLTPPLSPVRFAHGAREQAEHRRAHAIPSTITKLPGALLSRNEITF